MAPWAVMNGALGACVVLEGASLNLLEEATLLPLTRIRKDEPMQLIDLNEEASWLKMQPASSQRQLLAV